MLGWRKDTTDGDAAGGASASSGGAAKAPNAPTPNPGSGANESPASTGRLGDMLVREGAISAGQLQEALAKQRESGKFLGQVLVEMNFITQATLVSILVKQCKIPHISLVDYDVSEELFQLVPKDLCLKYNLLPIDKLGRILTLAMVDPLDLDALEQVRKTCPDIKIKPILCDWNHFDSVAKRVFHTVQQQDVQEVTAGSFGLSEKKPAAKAKPFEDTTQTAVDAAVDALVKEAAASPKPAAAARPRPDSVAPRQSDAARSQAAAPRPTPAVSAEVLGAQVSETVRAVLQEALQPLLEAGSRSQAEGNINTKAVAAELHAGLRDALQEALAPLLAEQQKLAERSAAAPALPDLNQFAGQIGQELRDSILSGVESVLRAQQDDKQDKRPAIDPEELTRLLQASIETPLHNLGQGIREALQARAEPAPPQPLPDFGALIGESVRSAVAEQESRLSEIAEAMMQATQTAEATLRAIQEERLRAEDSLPTNVKIANLEVFPGVGGDELSAGQLTDAGALDSPGLGMEGDERVREAIDSDRLLSGYTFNEFLVGPANTFTLKAAKALGEKLARDFNPLYVCGDEGLGKTHLLNAVGNAVLAKNPDLRVAYVSTSHFAGAFAKALKHDELSEFRDRFCRWDVLLIDDIQFLAGRQEAQEELFHVFNALVHEGRIVVIAGDRPPDKLTDFQKGLTSRFSSGIVTKLRPPEMDVRLAILKRYAESHRVAVSEEVLSLVATRIASDIRRMRGALRKVIAYAKLVEQEITREMANEVLDSLGAEDAA